MFYLQQTLIFLNPEHPHALILNTHPAKCSIPGAVFFHSLLNLLKIPIPGAVRIKSGVLLSCRYFRNWEECQVLLRAHSQDPAHAVGHRGDPRGNGSAAPSSHPSHLWVGKSAPKIWDLGSACCCGHTQLVVFHFLLPSHYPLLGLSHSCLIWEKFWREKGDFDRMNCWSDSCFPLCCCRVQCGNSSCLCQAFPEDGDHCPYVGSLSCCAGGWESPGIPPCCPSQSS